MRQPGAGNPLSGLRKNLGRKPGRDGGDPYGLRRRRRLTPGRVFKWLAVAATLWLLLAVVLFFVSAGTQEGVSPQTEEALDNSGSLLTGSTVLVLGSDQRPEGSKEPGANQAPSRADSILLLRVGFGSVRRLSILRDSRASIPGGGTQRINAAYAIGGASLTVETVENFLGNGLRINHVIEVNFERFPELIDSLGGIDIKLKRCVSSNRFGDKRVRLKKGEHHLSGREALRFARVRENRCAPNEDDRARAARQQQVLSAIRSKIASPRHWPGSFVRAPFIAWDAPRTVRTDMRGPGLAALFTDLLTGGAGSTEVLRPSGLNPDGSLIVSDQDKDDAVRELLGD